MRTLIFRIGTPVNIFGIELELIRKSSKVGDFVSVFQCDGKLASCHWNLRHRNTKCAVCRANFRNGWRLLKSGKNIELKSFTEIHPSLVPAPIIFQSVDELKQYKYDDEKIGYGVASTLITLIRDHRFNTVKYGEDINNLIITSINVYETLKKELLEFKPERVYIFNGRLATHLPTILLCKKLNIDFFVYEVATAANRYRLLKNATVHNAEAALEEFEATWASGTSDKEQIAKSWFELKRKGSTKGNMRSFTHKQAIGKLPEGFNPNKKNIAIFNKTIEEYASVIGWENRIYKPDETAGIGQILESFKNDEHYMFYLRVHPHMMEMSKNISQLRDIRKLSSTYKNLRVIWSDEPVDTYALMDACEKTIAFGATVGLEAAYWKKPSILAARAYYEKLDCFYKPQTHEELVELIKTDNLKPLPSYEVLKYAYHQMSGGIPFEYFKQTGKFSGTFDGVEIKSDALPELSFKFLLFISRLKKSIIDFLTPVKNPKGMKINENC